MLRSMTTILRRLLAAGLLLLALPAFAADAPDEAALWQALQTPGHALLLRHAEAPGIGDPPDFRIDDCGTQRNLSPEGKAQASAIGEQLRAHGIGRARVHSSLWCRCLDTARLLGFGAVEPQPALNSFFADASTAASQTEALRALLREATQDGGPLPVFVTHQVNITALTGVVPDSGEMLVLRLDGDKPVVLGRLR